MKSFILTRPGQLDLAELPTPEPGPYEVRIRIAYVGLCGSDVEAFLGHRKPEYLGNSPRLGHEPSGIIDAVGPHVTHLKVGDPATCVGTWGCYSEYVLARTEHVLKLPPELPLIDGSLVEVLPGIIMAATKTGITGAHDVCIVGQGLSGLLLTRLVSLQGCKRLIVADLFDEKLAIAREFGATHTINASREDVAARVLEITGGGADVTIMATLNGDDVPDAVAFTRGRGSIVLYGSIGPCAGINFFDVHRKGISIVKETTHTHGNLERRRLWREAMQLVADDVLPLDRLRTHVLPMDRLPEAMALRTTPRGDVIHVLVENTWTGQ
jgi:threonine dehydrogenase-like Zn-dependent dehydrogenase